MEQVVYADVLWLIDFSMDLLSLGIAARLTQRSAKGWRLCAAAALGGVWSVAALVCGADGAFGLLLDLAAAGGMILLAFGRSSPLRFGLTLGSFLLASLLLGGSMTALSNLFAGLGVQQTAGETGGGFFFLALAGSGITLLGTHIRRRAAPRTARLTLTVGERSVTVDALCDSGNLVRDPVSGRGVIFVAEGRLRELIDEPLRSILLARRIADIPALPPEAARRLCLVPAETVQGREMLIALRPDAVDIEGERCAALLCPTKLARGADYAAIVPAELVQTRKKTPIYNGKKE